MAGEKVDFAEAQTQAAGAATASKEQSTIAFPYYDVDAAMEVAKAVYQRRGLGECPLDELAAELRVTMSGNFRVKNSSARLFGFVMKSGVDAIKLTELGSMLVSNGLESEAKAEAFLNVPLYLQIYEKYRGKLLPPTKALEREMIALGVAQKQADKARQIFQRSARAAGYFASGDDRLVRPKPTQSSSSSNDAETLDIGTADRPQPTQERRFGGGNGGGSGGNGDAGSPSSDVYRTQLLAKFPEFDPSWPDEIKAKWFEGFSQFMEMAKN